MKLHAFILHNVSPDMFLRYDAKTSCLHHAHTFQVEADDTSRAANLIWDLTNIDSGTMLRVNFPHLAQYADQVDSYRQRRNRSLSVGDVIVFYHGERPAGAVAVKASGFEQLLGYDHIMNRQHVTNDKPVSASFYAHQDYQRDFDKAAVLESLKDSFGE